jgi:hypothetical protein
MNYVACPRIRRLALSFFLALLSAIGHAEDPPSTSLTNAAGGEPLRVTGLPKTDEFTKLEYRYFVWNDSNGWHLRTTTQKALRKFEGTITSSHDPFGKLRPIGLESNGKHKDLWEVDEGRKTIRFTIWTAKKFDGFDFDLPNNPDATLTFDLKIDGKDRPRHVFVGRTLQTPGALPLVVPAAP